MSGWTTRDMPHLHGLTAVVTGATSGLGLETAKALAFHGAAVTLAVRDTARGDALAAQIRYELPGMRVEVGRLDLADLASVREFAAAWTADHPDGLDLLVNNAGVMALPRRETADGFEMQFGTNHLGHFALTGLLLPSFVDRPGARVVTVSSGVHRMGRMNFDDLMGEQSYQRWSAYGQSKLANLLFAFELQRRLDAAGSPAISVAAHPGYAATNLQSVGPSMGGSGLSGLEGRLMSLLNVVVAQSAEMGALPTLYAATEPGVPGGSYVGPDSWFEQRGHPTLVGASGAAQDVADARRLWAESERLTGVTYALPVPTA